MRGVPEHIRSDNGAEMTAKVVRNWLTKMGAKTLFIKPGSPWENGYCESSNGKLRDEPLNGEIFYSLKEAQVPHRAMAKALQHRQAALIARLSVTGATDDEPVHDTARSGRANAIISQSRWYKISVRSHAVEFNQVSATFLQKTAIMAKMRRDFRRSGPKKYQIRNTETFRQRQEGRQRRVFSRHRCKNLQRLDWLAGDAVRMVPCSARVPC